VPELFHDAFYRFVRIADPEALASSLERVCTDAGVLGSVLVAEEGINAMLCGSSTQLQHVRDALESDSRFTAMTYKRTTCSAQVFKHLKIKRKKEIVPLGLEGVDAAAHRGVDIPPEAWRGLLERDDVIVIDNRNSFEFQLGRFKGAIDPGVDNFRDFAAYLESKLPEWQGKQIAMYCTGGIRCEKTTAWLAQRGLEVWQLEGGILNYFQRIPDAELDYEGTCFVFDERRELDTNAREVARG
jgi:UPF0176 protein